MHGRPVVRVVEIRPGEGGDDAYTFAHELANAITAHLERAGARVGRDDRGRTITLAVTASDAVDLEALAGTHRIQRIPRNDPRGRRHTSTATVAVLDADDRPAVIVDDADVHVEAFRASGAGGQHRNKTSSAIRLTHRPTGTVVVCADHRSQHRNLADARDELERRLADTARAGAAQARNSERVRQVRAERAAKTFTWNTQRDEVVDHTTGRRTRLRDALAGRLWGV